MLNQRRSLHFLLIVFHRMFTLVTIHSHRVVGHRITLALMLEGVSGADGTGRGARLE